MPVRDMDKWLEHLLLQHPYQDWDGRSGALGNYSGLGQQLYLSVNDAIKESVIESTDPITAPPGAVHLFTNAFYGHLAIDFDGGGTRCLTTGHGPDEVGNGLLFRSVYQMRARGNSYVGWSRYYGLPKTSERL